MKLVQNFWWGEDEKKRKVHWAAWDILTSPKNLGGVGFRDSKLMNQAMLARQCWRIIKHPNSLCARLLKINILSEGKLLGYGVQTGCFPILARNRVWARTD
jgi:hypothetical protein